MAKKNNGLAARKAVELIARLKGQEQLLKTTALAFIKDLLTAGGGIIRAGKPTCYMLGQARSAELEDQEYEEHCVRAYLGDDGRVIVVLQAVDAERYDITALPAVRVPEALLLERYELADITQIMQALAAGLDQFRTGRYRYEIWKKVGADYDELTAQPSFDLESAAAARALTLTQETGVEHYAAEYDATDEEKGAD